MLTLPACHSPRELDMARHLADRLDSSELHVFWTGQRPAAPTRPAVAPLSLLGAVGLFVDALADALTDLMRPAPRGGGAAQRQ